MSRKRYQGWTKFNREQHRRILSALDPASAQLARLQSCGTLSRGTHGWTKRCTRPACPTCRSMYATKQVKAAQRQFRGGSNATAGLFTVIIGADASLSEVEAMIAKARRDLRNLIDARRRRGRRWASLRLFGWLEMDAIDPQDVPLLAGNRRSLLIALGAGALSARSPVWIPTIHGVVMHPDLDQQEVRDALSEVWELEAQVHIAPFLDHLTFDQNIENSVSYSLKHRCSTNIKGIEEPWPARWLANYYEWLNVWSSSFRSTRFLVRELNMKATYSTDIFDTDEACMNHIDPQPIDFYFSG